jgi:hypothetical protein
VCVLILLPPSTQELGGWGSAESTMYYRCFSYFFLTIYFQLPSFRLNQVDSNAHGRLLQWQCRDVAWMLSKPNSTRWSTRIELPTSRLPPGCLPLSHTRRITPSKYQVLCTLHSSVGTLLPAVQVL